MSWTQGQQNRTSQSPFIDPLSDDRTQKAPASSGYSKPNVQRNDYNQRPPQNSIQQRQPQMRDVAATFTQEGLQTFSLIFSSAVEAAIAKTLPDLVERAVERKMQDLVQQVRGEISDVLTPLAETAFAAVEQRIEAVIERLATSTTTVAPEIAAPVVVDDDAVITEEPAPAPFVPVAEVVPAGVVEPKDEPAAVEQSRIPAASRLEQDVQTLIQTMKKLGRPVKTDELRTLIPDIKWGSNPSIKMSNLMQKSNGQIERTSKGIYQYKQA